MKVKLSHLVISALCGLSQLSPLCLSNDLSTYTMKENNNAQYSLIKVYEQLVHIIKNHEYNKCVLIYSRYSQEKKDFYDKNIILDEGNTKKLLHLAISNLSYPEKYITGRVTRTRRIDSVALVLYKDDEERICLWLSQIASENRKKHSYFTMNSKALDELYQMIDAIFKAHNFKGKLFFQPFI